MSNDPPKPESTVFTPPVSAFVGPIAELVGHRFFAANPPRLAGHAGPLRSIARPRQRRHGDRSDGARHRDGPQRRHQNDPARTGAQFPNRPSLRQGSRRTCKSCATKMSCPFWKFRTASKALILSCRTLSPAAWPIGSSPVIPSRRRGPWRSPGRWRKGCNSPIAAASFTAISNPPTFCSARRGRLPGRLRPGAHLVQRQYY